MLLSSIRSSFHTKGRRTIKRSWSKTINHDPKKSHSKHYLLLMGQSSPPKEQLLIKSFSWWPTACLPSKLICMYLWRKDNSDDWFPVEHMKYMPMEKAQKVKIHFGFIFLVWSSLTPSPPNRDLLLPGWNCYFQSCSLLLYIKQVSRVWLLDPPFHVTF